MTHTTPTLRDHIVQALAAELMPRYGGPQHRTPGGLPLTATAEEVALHRAQPLADAVLTMLSGAALTVARQALEVECPECGTDGACAGGPCPLIAVGQPETEAPAVDRATVLNEAADVLDALEAEAWGGADSEEFIGRATGVGTAKDAIRRMATEARQISSEVTKDQSFLTPEEEARLEVKWAAAQAEHAPSPVKAEETK